MVRLFQGLGLSLSFVIFLSGCGNSQLADNVNIFLDLEEGLAGVEIEMSDGLQVNLDGEFLIGGNNYGVITFVQPTKYENGSIRIAVDLHQLADDNMGGFAPVTKLPNGAQLPVAVLPPLLSIPVLKNSSTEVNALISVIPELQVAATIAMSQFNSSRFPTGVSICQNFRNDDGMAFAAVCLYGPGNNKSGGIFVGATLGEVFDFDLLQSQLMAAEHRSSSTALTSLSSDRAAVQAQSAQSVSYESWAWTQERRDYPGRRLTNRHLQNARAILRRR